MQSAALLGSLEVSEGSVSLLSQKIHLAALSPSFTDEKKVFHRRVGATETRTQVEMFAPGVDPVAVDA